MHLVLDTSIVIEIERNNKDVISRLDNLRKKYPFLSKIAFFTYFEFIEGISLKSEKNKEKFFSLIENFEVIQTTRKTAQILVGLRKKYEFPMPNLLIAAQVIENDGILVSRDNDFNDIKELKKIII